MPRIKLVKVKTHPPLFWNASAGEFTNIAP